MESRAVQNEAGKCGLDGREAIQRLHDLAERVRDSLEGMKDEGWSLEILKTAGIDARLDAACEWARS